ncbi:Asparagine synthase [anaerobic digester metagenome]
MLLRGWTELDGQRCAPGQLEELLRADDPRIARLGGEFYFEVDGWRGRDALGIMPGACPPGELQLDGVLLRRIEPEVPDLSLGDAIELAVRRRADEGVVALSGGVDSALIAAIAGRPCVAVGLEGSHDLERARYVADLLHLDLAEVVIPPERIPGVLKEVLGVIPVKSPLNASIAATLYFVAEWAGARGYERILAGQGADEVFGGYARYAGTEDLGAMLARDFASLPVQRARDQETVGIFGCYLSMPYLDPAVLQAVRALPVTRLVGAGPGKAALREVAATWIPPEIAAYPKKAMQYGSGVWREIRRLSRHNGYKNAVQGYLTTLERNEHGR